MRLSPVALALLTVSAALGTSDAAWGQTAGRPTPRPWLGMTVTPNLPSRAADEYDESLASLWTDSLAAWESDLAAGSDDSELSPPLAIADAAPTAYRPWEAERARDLAEHLESATLWTLAAAPEIAEPVELEPSASWYSQAGDNSIEFETLNLDEPAAAPAPPDSPPAPDPELLPDAEPPSDFGPTDRELPGDDLGQDPPPAAPAPLEDEIPTAPPDEPEPRVLVAEVLVQGEGLTTELEDIVYNAIQTRPGRTTTRAQLQEDVNAIFATGFFANVTQVPEDTPLGVRITFAVQPNPILRRVEIETRPPGSTRAIPDEVIEEIFSKDYGEILNLREFQDRIAELNAWYQDEAQGYDLAQVVGSPNVAPNGVVTLRVAEGTIEAVRVRFFNDENEEVDGNTRDFIITREMRLAPGLVFRRQTAQEDLQRVFGLGLFEDARLSFSPGENPEQVVVNVDVQEGRTGSLAAGAGISSASGLFGTVSFQQRNLGGNNQSLAAELQAGTRELLFDVSFTDPWIATDPYRTSYTINAFRRQTISLIFDRGDPEVRLPNGDRPRIVRNGGGITFTRPLDPDPLSRSDWTLSAGFQYQGVSVRDADGNLSPRDSLGNLLAATPNGQDILAMLQFGAVYDLRDSTIQPTSGSVLRLGMDQTLPIGAGQIVFNRLRASYSYYIPVEWFDFNPEDDNDAQTLAFNLQGGTIFGELPPYEAFSLGGASSVRGFGEGDVGAGRSYLQATAEYRFPVLSFLTGALFVDYATDLGTGDDVPGNPAGIRNKPGSGFGYGLGVRVQSPLGPIRVDFGFSDRGESRIHFGIGERF